jgi:TnpA family transposase
MVHQDETYSAALAELVNAQKKSGLCSMVQRRQDNIVVRRTEHLGGSHGRYAGQVNLKYGQEPGVRIYTHIQTNTARSTPK